MFTGAKKNKSIRKKQTKILFSKEKSFSDFCYSHKSKFILDEQLYFEGLKYNTCLNKKVTIDSNGKVKNCLFMPETYGDYIDINLIINSKKFQKIWRLSKDRIDICKDCEKRYMCVDCRAFRENKQLDSKPNNCNYDPYI